MPDATLSQLRAAHRCLSAFTAMWLLTLLLGCGSEKTAHLEENVEGAWLNHPVQSYLISGERDGATTTARATLEFGKSRRLHLELEVAYNPTPTLKMGRWILEGIGPSEGQIVAESVRFVGGQGEGPSLGGRFRLDEDGSPRFRVELPLQPVDEPKWNVE